MVTGGSSPIERQVVTLLCDASVRVRVVFSDSIKVDIKANNVYGNSTRMTLECLGLIW